MGRKIGYARSGYAQGKGGINHQMEVLKEAGCATIIVDDKITDDFPWHGLSEAFGALKSGDTFIVTELNRISRWIPEVVIAMETLKEIGAPI